MVARADPDNVSDRASYTARLNGKVGSVRVRNGMWAGMGSSDNALHGFAPEATLGFDTETTYLLSNSLAVEGTYAVGNVVETAGDIVEVAKNRVGSSVVLANTSYYFSATAAYAGIGPQKGTVYRTGALLDELKVLMMGYLSTYALSPSTATNHWLTYPKTIPVGSAYSIEAWVKLDATAPEWHTLVDWSVGGNRGLRIIAKSDRSLCVQEISADAVVNSVTATTRAIPAATWTYVVVQ